jgi:glycosyltransferase involved in cell wall biosynthesis
LQALIDRLGIANRARLLGAVRNPYAYLRESDLFVLSSRFEAFPNALLEAMAAGLTPVSYECCEGVRQIVRDGVDGVLVAANDVDALVAAMEGVMADAPRRAEMAAHALEVRQRFGVEKVMSMWDDTIAAVRPANAPIPAV